MKRFIRRIIRYINLGSAILLVLSFLSPHISPAKLWIPSFLGLAYPYILLINLGFLIFWIIMKKREFIISFLAILLGWNTLISYFSIHPGSVFKKSYFTGLSREDRVSNKQIKVMSYNVMSFDRYNWSDKPTAQQDVFEIFRSEDPDILCLQEFFHTERGSPGLDEIISVFDRMPYSHIEATSRRGGWNFGNAIFSNYPIVGSGRMKLNRSRIVCIYADIKVFEDTLRVYNMHLRSTRLGSRDYQLLEDPILRYGIEQMKEIKYISSRLKYAFIIRADQAEIIASHVSDSPHPVIVCGDFNDTPVSYTYHRISEGLEDAFVKCGWGIGRTYNGKFPSFRIDYILHSNNLEANHFSRQKVRISDHYPITSTLKIHPR